MCCVHIPTYIYPCIYTNQYIGTVPSELSQLYFLDGFVVSSNTLTGKDAVDCCDKLIDDKIATTIEYYANGIFHCCCY